MKSAFLLTLLVASIPATGLAQKRFFHAWEDRVRVTSAKQPAWPVPVFGPPSTIVQLARLDFTRQYTSTHTLTWNYDGGKGVNFIPFAKTEFDINMPAYIQHNTPKVLDGAGDFSTVIKYRPFSGNEKKGSYSTLVQLAFSVPTGSYKNGTSVSTITPLLAAGKGFHKFDVQSALGGILPTSSVPAIGRTIQWNTTAQYKSAGIFGPRSRQMPATSMVAQTTGRTRSFSHQGS